MDNRLTLSRSAVRENRGFGLFSDDEGDESEVERFPVSFSGNKSGFEVLGRGVNGVDREGKVCVSWFFMLWSVLIHSSTSGERESHFLLPDFFVFGLKNSGDV
jgi:hypothetical protein